jgi:arsenate reductase (glutaredoxin)
MADKITVYQKPTCSKCREVDRILRESGADYEAINYYVDPISEAKLRELLQKLDAGPRDILRTSDPIYNDLGIAQGNHSDDELIALIAKHPDLLQRPIVERGSKAVLGRPPENIRALL